MEHIAKWEMTLKLIYTYIYITYNAYIQCMHIHVYTSPPPPPHKYTYIHISYISCIYVFRFFGSSLNVCLNETRKKDH